MIIFGHQLISQYSTIVVYPKAILVFRLNYRVRLAVLEHLLERPTGWHPR